MKKVITALTATAALTTYGLSDQAEASSYKVQSGDTLWKIANQNSVSVSQLKSWNNLSSDMIYVNQSLKTSGNSSSSASSSSSSSSSSSASKSNSSSSASGTYTVKSGDTLSKIARAHDMNYRTLMNINNISSHIIYPGQKLSLSGSSSSSSSSSNSSSNSNSSSSSSSSSSASTGSYTVKSGDTLSRIASAHGTTYRNIMKLNNLSSTIIYPGQSLKVSGTASSDSSSASSSSSVSSSSSASESSSSVTQNVSAPAPTNVSYGKNYYYWGDCTWYVFERRQQLGKPVGNNWGNAYDWDTKARSAGYAVSNSPSVGAIMQADAWTNSAWGLGHVAVVERINSDGSILVSEMNFGSGKGAKSFRTISASKVSGHNFIH